MKMQEIRTFGRRNGKKISTRQQYLVDNVLPKLYPTNNMDKNILEIGFGNGEHLQQISVQFPEYNIIGAEPFMNGVASLLSSITDENTNEIIPEYKNFQIFSDDVRQILNRGEEKFLDIKFDKIYVLHPDPWPKARHEKRRLLNSDFLNLLSTRLKSDGEIIIGTDHWGYYDWIIEQVEKTNLIANEIDMEIIKTRYQIKNKANTSNPKYLMLKIK